VGSFSAPRRRRAEALRTIHTLSLAQNAPLRHGRGVGNNPIARANAQWVFLYAPVMTAHPSSAP
jgi:hypothetical protein